MKTEIDKNAVLQTGDIIEMHFNVIGDNTMPWLRAFQLNTLISTLQNRNDNYDLLNWENLDNEVILTFKIIEPVGPPETQQAGVGMAVIIGTIVIGAGIFTWLSLDKIYKITSSPTGKVASVGLGLGGVAVLIIVIVGVLGLKMGKK